MLLILSAGDTIQLTLAGTGVTLIGVRTPRRSCSSRSARSAPSPVSGTRSRRGGRRSMITDCGRRPPRTPAGHADAAAGQERAGSPAARGMVDSRWTQVVASRDSVGSVDVAFQVYEADRNKGGGLMAGAVAFRMFAALVPATLVVLLTFGSVAHVAEAEGDDIARQAGITGLAAEAVKSAAENSTTSTVVTLAIATFALFLASNSLAKTLRVVNFLVWDLPLQPFKRSWRGGLAVIGLFVGLAAHQPAHGPGPADQRTARLRLHLLGDAGLLRPLDAGLAPAPPPGQPGGAGARARRWWRSACRCCTCSPCTTCPGRSRAGRSATAASGWRWPSWVGSTWWAG